METWKIAGLVIAALASVTGILGALYGIVTVPVLRTLKAEISAAESRLKTQIIENEAQLKMRITENEAQLRMQITESESRLKVQMTEMEARLNQRIDTRLVHR